MTTSTIATESPAPSERAVKAAILYRAAKFIEWPAQSFVDQNAPFLLCVAGDDAALRAFDDIVGRTINGHQVQIRRVTGDIFDLRVCHAAFFSAEAETDIDYALNKLRGLPVFTVGEQESFAYRGGMLALLTNNQRVTFTFNLHASRRAGLGVNAQLLKLATVVGTSP